MALDSQNWKREYHKSRAEVEALKAELEELRESSNTNAENSTVTNELAALRADVNSLIELVKILAVNQMSANIALEMITSQNKTAPAEIPPVENPAPEPVEEKPVEVPSYEEKPVEVSSYENENDDDESEEDEVFEKVREVLAYQLGIDEYEIEDIWWAGFDVYSDDFQDAMSELADYYGIEIPYDDYTDFSDVDDIVTYIKNYDENDYEDNSYYSSSSYGSNTDNHDARTVTTIENRTGIHARPASLFVQTASKFRSNIQISAKGKTVDAKSILMIMSMGLTRGTEITITADGPDAFDAVYTLRKLVDDKFGED